MIRNQKVKSISIIKGGEIYNWVILIKVLLLLLLILFIRMKCYF